MTRERGRRCRQMLLHQRGKRTTQESQWENFYLPPPTQPACSWSRKERLSTGQVPEVNTKRWECLLIFIAKPAFAADHNLKKCATIRCMEKAVKTVTLLCSGHSASTQTVCKAWLGSSCKTGGVLYLHRHFLGSQNCFWNRNYSLWLHAELQSLVIGSARAWQ